nr:hypothetical protein [uncultured Pseudomonas sp.]
MDGSRALCLSPLLLPLAAAADVLRLVAAPWPPLNDRNLPHNGVASDLVSTALGWAGYATHYREVPWERALRGLHILVRRSLLEHERIVAAFDRAIAAIRADGSYAAILERHGL